MELKLDRITKQYKNKIAVDRATLTLTPGVYGLLGANGAGKTTLMRLICGVLKPDSGNISLDGIDVSCEAYRDRLGYLPQDFGCYPEFTAMDFLIYMAGLKGIPKKQAIIRSNSLLKMTGLEHDGSKKVRAFSGGMKQRLGIAQALLNQPDIIILDEPTAGLDPKERVRFRNMISQMGTDQIVLLSTHIVTDIEYVAGHILMMKEGTILHNGSLNEIISVIDGKVWEMTIPKKNMKLLPPNYTVVNIREEGENLFLRLICDKKPCENAISAKAVLEDLYLYYFNDSEVYV